MREKGVKTREWAGEEGKLILGCQKVCLEDLMEKPEQTFWSTQYNSVVLDWLLITPLI